MNQLFFRAIDYHAEKQNKYWKLHLILFEELYEQKKWKLSRIWQIQNDLKDGPMSACACACVLIKQTIFINEWKW